MLLTDATIIIAKPAQTIPSTRAEKLRGVPSPMPLFNKTPHANLCEVANKNVHTSEVILNSQRSFYI